MKDIDARIAGKNAEYETLARGVASMLEKHEELRESFNEELREKAEQAEKELDEQLRSKREELSGLEKNLAKQKKLLEEVIDQKETFEKESEASLKDISDQRIVSEEIIATLTAQKLSIEAELQVNENRLTDVTTLLSERQNEFSEIERKVAERSTHLEEIYTEITEAEESKEEQRRLWVEEEEKVKKDLLNISASLDGANKLLVQAQSEESVIRDQIAAELTKLDKREQNLEAREAKVAQQERRLFNYSKFNTL